MLQGAEPWVREDSGPSSWTLYGARLPACVALILFHAFDAGGQVEQRLAFFLSASALALRYLEVEVTNDEHADEEGP